MSRHTRKNNPREGQPAVVTAEPHAIVHPGREEPKGWLVATEEKGVCVLFAPADSKTDISFGELYDFTLMPSDALDALGKAIEFPPTSQQSQASLGQTVGQSASTANLVAQVAQAAYQAHGLVRLSPETLALLDGGAKTLQSAGWNIGALSGSGGQFVGTLQWLPAGAATPLAVAASAGVALTLMALQWQLGRIEGLAAKAVEVSTEILNEIVTDQRSDVASRAKRLRDAIIEANRAGEVSDAVWEGFSPEMENQLDRLRRDVERRVKMRVADLNEKKLLKDRLQWMNEHGESLVQDLITLIVAFQSLYSYWALRVARNLRRNNSNASEGAVAETVKDHAKRDLGAMRETLEPSLESLWRYFSLIMECPGSLGLTIWGRNKKKEITRNAAVQLRQLIGEVQERFVGHIFPEPSEIQILQNVAPLRWLLKTDEKIISCIDFQCLLPPKQYMFVATSQRLLVLQPSVFMSNGSVDEERDNTNIKYEFAKVGDDIYMYVCARSGKKIHTVVFREKNDLPEESEIASLTAI
ncbi:hypothetical protein CCR95_04500 [Thiocystis minor]|uniref:hypothetical protein n=1 Tax=Thiocystis minor TaxID=61597 RepID=UPI0019128024|nr:hypothetical protein [Thiocystis minor]MBK5963368.1 hypothetical protein [Thiocystis minor]